MPFTGVLIKYGISGVVELQDECAGFGEKREEARHVFYVRPVNAIAFDWHRCHGISAPD